MKSEPAICQDSLLNFDAFFVGFKCFHSNSRDFHEILGRFKGALLFEAVLISIFGKSSAPETANHARIATIKVTHEIQDRNFRIPDLLCDERVKERVIN
jgi:hypothetical protein